MKTKILAILILLVSFSCTKERKIGVLKVNGLKNIFITIYQDREFDFVTGLYYEISDSEKEIIIPETHLIGTNDYITSLENFQAKSIDSTLYLTWGNVNEVFAVYDLKSGKGYPRGKTNDDWEKELEIGNELIKKLKEKKPKLNANWDK